MAKADFCFNFYDGDATRDMAHMNRLERGAYMDVLVQQRQRGHLSIDDLKKFLSKDFDAVWAALEWVMKKDGGGKFFIEWLETSEARSKTHSRLQKDRRSGKTKQQPKTQFGQPSVEPEGDGYGSGDGIEIIEIGERKEFSIGIRAVFAGEKPRRVYDLVEYFRTTDQLEQVTRAGWTDKFGLFMNRNPGAVYDDDHHVYNAVKRFVETGNTTPKKLTKQEIMKQLRQ